MSTGRKGRPLSIIPLSPLLLLGACRRKELRGPTATLVSTQASPRVSARASPCGAPPQQSRSRPVGLPACPPPRTRALGPVGLPAQRPTLTLALAPWGSPRRPPRSRSPQGAPCTASPLHPRSRSLPQPQRWTRARGDEGLGRGGSAHRAPRAGRPFAEGSALEIAPL